MNLPQRRAYQWEFLFFGVSMDAIAEATAMGRRYDKNLFPFSWPGTGKLQDAL